jgi:hypothetical protein
LAPVKLVFQIGEILARQGQGGQFFRPVGIVLHRDGLQRVRSLGAVNGQPAAWSERSSPGFRITNRLADFRK